MTYLLNQYAAAQDDAVRLIELGHPFILTCPSIRCFVRSVFSAFPAFPALPTFAECFLKPRQSSGLLGAKLSRVAVESNACKTENRSHSVEEVADGLQS